MRRTVPALLSGPTRLVALAIVLWLPAEGYFRFARVGSLPPQCGDQCTLQMLDAQSGWLFGGRFLWSTSDGGITWQTRPFPTLRPGDSAHGKFMNRREGWLLANSQQLYEASDGGTQWTPQPVPQFDGTIRAAWLLLNDSINAWLGGGEYRPSSGPDGPNYAVKRYRSGGWGLLNPVVFRRNGAAAWSKQLLPECSWSIFNVQFWSPMKGVALGDNGCVYLTEAGGDRWTLATLRSRGEPVGDVDEGVPTIFFPVPNDKGWLSTRSGLYQTSDGGKTWYEISAKGTPHFDVFVFPDTLHGLGIAKQSEIYESVDGGRTWKRLESAALPRSLCLLDKKIWLISDSEIYSVLY
jgi:photosystem II stability/assembly factor-like uncharacterized protein